MNKPDYEMARFELGRALLQQGDPTDAIESLEAAKNFLLIATLHTFSSVKPTAASAACRKGNRSWLPIKNLLRPIG
jgi:hypothetical protein